MGNSIWSYFSTPLTDIWQAIKLVPFQIISDLQDLLIVLFVPSESYFNDKFSGLQDTFSAKFDYDLGFAESLQSVNSKTIDNIDVNIMGVSATIVDFTYLDTALNFARPVIQAFIYFMLSLFHVNSVYKLLRGTNLVDIKNTVSNVKGD